MLRICVGPDDYIFPDLQLSKNHPDTVGQPPFKVLEVLFLGEIYPYSATCAQVQAFSLAPGLGLAALFTPLAMSKIRSVVTLLGPLYQCQHLQQRKGFEG